MKKGFTLSEVLITLGVIGVIAAITLPAVINKCKIFVLEMQFKKASSILENAVQQTFFEVGNPDLVYKPKNIVASISSEESSEINTKFKSYLNYQHILKLKRSAVYVGVDELSDSVAKKKLYFPNGDLYGWYIYNAPGGRPFYILKDGIVISSLSFQTHNINDGIKIFVDTNGPFKGPNRFGYDAFVYDTGLWENWRCESTNTHYIYGCYKKAKQDKDYWKKLK